MLLIPAGRSLNSIFPGYMSAFGGDRIFFHTIGKLSFLLVRLFSILTPILLIATTSGQTFGGNALTLTLTATNVTCNGQNNGAISSVLTGGTGGTVNYTLNPGSVSNTSGVFNNLTAGSYTVSADDSGNIATSMVTITEPATKLISKITSQVDVRCKGNASGSVTVTGMGGTAGYTYSMDGGTTYKASGTFSTLTVGSYTVRVKDANGCYVDQMVTIAEPASVLSAAASSDSPVCSNAILTLSAIGSGGTVPFSYTWTGPNSFSSTNQSPSIVGPTASNTGNYNLTITDANNCTATNSTSVIIRTAPIVSANASINTICAGGSVNLTSSSNISPAPSPPAPILSAINNSSGGTTASAAWTIQNDGYSSNGQTFHSNDNSSFYLSDSRAQNGTKTETILKSQAYNTIGYSTLRLSFWHYFRFNNSLNESAKVQVSLDGSTWISVATYVATAGSSGSFVNVNINLDSYVNKSILFIRFYYYSDARARYWAIDNVSISGTSIPCVPVIAWSSNPAGFSSAVANPPTVNPNTTTTYTATYTDPSTGCSNNASTTITVNPKPDITIQPNYCAVPGKVRLTAGGGTTYTWTTGETTNVILTDIANTYGVTSTNAFGCTGSSFLPVATELVTNGDFSAGNMGFTNAYANVSTGYTGIPTSGLWPEGLYAVGADPTFYHPTFFGRDHTTNSGKFLIVNGIGSAGVVVWQETVTVLPNTNYYFSAWAISLNSVPPYANLQFNVNGTLVGSTAPLAARVENNNPPYNWQRFYGNWNSGASTTAVIQIVDLQTALGGNDFGLDDVSFGTLAPISFTLTPTANLSATICSGNTMYLKANINGGKAPITYSWNGPIGFTSALKDPIIPNVTVAHSGLYKLSVVDGYGCDPEIASTTATIFPSPIPLISSISGLGIVCPSSQQKFWTTAQNDVTNNWSVTGGNIIGSAVKDSVNIQWSNSGTGIITLKSTNTISLCDSTITKTVFIQDLISPVISCPATLNISGCDETALTGNPFSATELTIPLSQLILMGGSASDNCALSTTTYKDTKSGTKPVLVTRTFSAYDFAGNKSTCSQNIIIKDNDPPILVVGASINFCVEDLISASIAAGSFKLSPTPDYFLFKKGSTVLDISAADMSDNCTPANQLILNWKIDFSASTPLPSISGTGQPSAYASDIIFPGDGSTFMDVTHKITYWVVDQSGNESLHKSVTITIHPRPVVSYHDGPELIYSIDTNTKT